MSPDLTHEPFSYFLSDVHLMQKDAATAASFTRFMTQHAPRAEAVYLVGDLFEVYIGLDGFDEFEQRIAATLKTLSAQTAVYWMVGNRDFLLNAEAAQRLGLTFLDDPTIIERYGQRLLLTHGDALCSDDVPYQRLRHIVRTPLIQWLFRRLPLKARQQLADRARQGSQAHTQRQRAEYMDINDDLARRWLSHAQCPTLLHGHTHRAGKRVLPGTDRDYQIITLGDWHPDGVIARWDPRGIELLSTDQIGS